MNQIVRCTWNFMGLVCLIGSMLSACQSDSLPTGGQEETPVLQNPELKATQGESFASILINTAAQHKEYVMATYLEDNLAMVANDQWKYMFTTGSRDLGISYQTGFGPSGIVHRLYDLQNDPTESKNLANDPAYEAILLEMQEQMVQRFAGTHPDAAKCPDGLSTEGKLVWYCEPRDIGTDQSLYDVPVRVFPAQ